MKAIEVQNRSLVALIDLIQATPAEKRHISWPEMMDTVKAANIPVKNWMHVRGALQTLINERILQREPDLYFGSGEEYIILRRS